MKKKNLDAFKKLGFEMEKYDDVGYCFVYEGLPCLCMDNEEEGFLSIVVPAIIDRSDFDDLEFYQVMNELNTTLKYVKAIEKNNAMWFFYERELIGDEDLEEVIPKMILHLEHSVRYLCSGGMYTDNEDNEI